MKEFWDERYASAEYAYGEAPNAYFRERLALLKPGRILLPADGEGRNGVHAALSGWEVHSFDISEAGARKALALAARSGVRVDYRIGSAADIPLETDAFDALALVYAHFPSAVRRAWHRRLLASLKPGGTLILEAFGSKHLPYVLADGRVGGPRDPDLLYDMDAIREDFTGCAVMEAREGEGVLAEGRYHYGKGWILQVHARKEGRIAS